MKEIKVGTLTREEKEVLKEIRAIEEKVGTLISKHNSAYQALWKTIRFNHSIFEGNHYIVGNSIYRQDIANENTP